MASQHQYIRTTQDSTRAAAQAKVRKTEIRNLGLTTCSSGTGIQRIAIEIITI